MRTFGFASACLVLSAILLCSSTTALADAPALNIPADALKGNSLQQVYVNSIQGYIKYWVSFMQQAKTPKEMLEAQQGLIDGYAKYDNPGYHFEYANQMATAAKPALAKLTDMRAVRLAMACSQMPAVSIQSVLEDMVRHPNAGVRFLGWRGYLGGDLRSMVMAQGETASKTLFDSIAQRAAQETDPAVCGAIMEMIWVPSSSMLINPEAYKAAQKKMWDLLQKTWPRMCTFVIKGDGEAARAAILGLHTLDNYTKAVEGIDKNKALQLVVDMMYAAAKSYDAQGAEGDVAEADAQLARDCEGVICRLSGTSKNYVQKALADSGATDRGAAVVLAVLQWVGDLKAQGVTTPSIDSPAKAAQKTTAPAAK